MDSNMETPKCKEADRVQTLTTKAQTSSVEITEELELSVPKVYRRKKTMQYYRIEAEST
jgi:hypothetical protein